jgi:hypothetical protein
MKNIFFLFCVLLALQSYSQPGRDRLETGREIDQKDLRNNINAKVYRSFFKMFGNVVDVHWSIGENEVIAYFIRDDVPVTAQYKKNGSLIFAREVYDGKKLESSVKNFLRGEIEARYSINLVVEIRQFACTFYEVGFQDKSSWCFVLLKKEGEEISVIDKEILDKS